jgi:hypothetical protein
MTQKRRTTFDSSSKKIRSKRIKEAVGENIPPTKLFFMKLMGRLRELIGINLNAALVKMDQAAKRIELQFSGSLRKKALHAANAVARHFPGARVDAKSGVISLA